MEHQIGQNTKPMRPMSAIANFTQQNGERNTSAGTPNAEIQIARNTQSPKHKRRSQMKPMNKPLYGWEIRSRIPSPKDPSGENKVSCFMIVAAPTIEDVWNYLAADRKDERTEIEGIIRFGPIVAILGTSQLAEAQAALAEGKTT